MWPHYCRVERAVIQTGDGEQCAWCQVPDSRGIMPVVKAEGQPFVDDPVFAKNKRVYAEVRLRPVAGAVASAFGVAQRTVEVLQPNGYRRTSLRWMKSDGKGGLVPR